jgi:transmembrane protein EpsG
MFSQYVLILIWIGAMALIGATGTFKRVELVCGYEEYRYAGLFVFILFVPIILMATFRGYFADTSAYIISYLSMPTSISQAGTYLASVTKDKGFTILSILIKSLVGKNYVPYLMIIAFLQGISLIVFFRKYSSDSIFSIFLFIASTDYISWMFNGMRQFTAVTIILFATPFILKKKYIPAILLILLASTMHQSALIMIPFIFITQGDSWNKKTITFIVAALLAVAFVDQFTSLLDETLSTTQYVNVVSDYTSWNDDGTNPFRVAVYSLPALLSFIGRKRIQAEGNVLINFCANMSIISMGIYLVSMVTSGIFIGRLPIYCSLFGYILLPWEIENLFTPESRKIMKASTVVAYLLFYYYQMHVTSGLF